MTSVRVLFVCMGNICRSPMAHAVLAKRVAQRGLEKRVEVDSCGLGDWHVGNPPDQRSIACGRLRGYDLKAIRARQFEPQDFEIFTLLVAMDRGHFDELQKMAPESARERIKLFMDFHPEQTGLQDVPDPYYGEFRDFDLAMDLIEQGVEGLVKSLQKGP